jgi:hypothetical protein
MRHAPTRAISSTALSRHARFQPLRPEVYPGVGKARYGAHKSGRTRTKLILVLSNAAGRGSRMQRRSHSSWAAPQSCATIPVTSEEYMAMTTTTRTSPPARGLRSPCARFKAPKMSCVPVLPDFCSPHLTFPTPGDTSGRRELNLACWESAVLEGALVGARAASSSMSY